jgi:hypothetical protein
MSNSDPKVDRVGVDMSVTFHNAHALVIGVGGDLPVTVDDAKAIATILSDPNRCAIPADNVRVLTEMGATRSGIISALQELTGKAKPEDAVTIYYSGHGGMLSSVPERRFIVPRDGEWLDGKQFTDLLRDIPARRLLVLLDCCYAGGVHTERDAKAPEVKSVPVPFDVRELRLREGAGTVVLSSSKDDEISLTGEPYSIFTQVIVKALCGDGAARRDGYVRVGDLAMYLAQWVPSLTNNSQHPQLDLEAADNYPIAYYAAGSKAKLRWPDWFVDTLTGRAAKPPVRTSVGSAERSLSVPSALGRLRDILAEWISDENEARRIVRNSGMRAGIAWRSDDSMSFWQTALEKAHRAWRTEELFQVADEVFGENPDWQDAKQGYLTAREAERRARIHPVGYQDHAAVSPSLNERRLRALDSALGRVVPNIFQDPRIRVDKLDAANAALLSVGPIIEALRAAANAENRQPMRHELQQLEHVLQKHYNAVSQKLSLLEQVGSEEEAMQPCEDLAIKAAALLAACTQAIKRVT